MSEFHGFSPCYQQRACGFTLETLRVDVKEIGTYKLDLQGGQTLTFMWSSRHAGYPVKSRSVISLIKKFDFNVNKVDINNETDLLWFGYISKSSLVFNEIVISFLATQHFC